jgi:hypothetical protein
MVARKRQLDVSSTYVDLQRKQRRRIDNSREQDDQVESSVEQRMDKALIALIKRHSMGVAVDEAILDQILCRSSMSRSDITPMISMKKAGILLMEHPFALNALMQSMFLPGGRLKSIDAKKKCATLIAMAVIASEKKIIDELDEEDQNLDWVKKLCDQSSNDDIANVSLFCLFY